MINLALDATSPQSNPDRLRFIATFAGNYGVQGAGDLLNLAPAVSGQNAGGFTNPKMLELPDLPVGYTEAPAVIAENLGGYYVQLTPIGAAAGAANGVAKTVAPVHGFGLRVFAPGGGELASNAAYPAAVLNGNVIIEALLPQNQ